MKKSTTITLVILLLLIAGFAFWWNNKAKSPLVTDQISQVSILHEFPGKIVYAGNIGDPVPFEQDCRVRGGAFNVCGTSCTPDEEICSQQCVYTCDLTENPAETPKDPNDPANWAVYKFPSGDAELKYPGETLDTKTEDNQISFTHRIPYAHQDPCDFRGEGPDLRELTDFDVIFHLVEKGLKDTVNELEAEDFAKDNMQGNTLKLSQGFIDAFTLGKLQGYQITLGVENCGMYEYYLPLSSKQTLVITRAFVTEFRMENMKNEVLKLKNVIVPDQEEKLFRDILGTFTVKNS